MRIWFEILLVSLKLGLTSFGGPTAHLGYFQHEYVRRKKWISNEQYSDLVALCQFLPGPASSQVGIGIGLLRGGIIGSIVAFIGFTLPSVIFLMICAYFFKSTSIDISWIQGLKLVAVAIVAQAILDMAKKLLPSLLHKFLAIVTLMIVLFWQSSLAQIVAILLAACIGFFLLRRQQTASESTVQFPISKTTGAILLSLFFSLLVFLPITARLTEHSTIMLFEKFYTASAFVFGGGHVVLPLLKSQFVTEGYLTASEFLTGYGLTQAVPGPLFTFAAYIGTIIDGVFGGLLATIAIFLPAFLLVIGTLPFWHVLSTKPKLRSAISGMNAAVVGILTAAFITPILSDSIHSISDGIFATFLFLLLVKGKQPPWVIVLAGLIIGFFFY